MDFDYNKLLETTGDDEDLARELIGIFLDQYESMLKNIAQAVQGKQAEELHRAAHKLKGSLQALGAGPSLDLVISLETIAINDDLSQAENVFTKLEAAFDSLVPALRNIGKVAVK